MTDPYTSTSSVAIVGAGKVGRTLARFLISRDIPVHSIITSPGSNTAGFSGMFPGSMISDRIDTSLATADSIFICVPDERIEPVANSLLASGADLHGKLIAHTSGLRTSEELSVLDETGALYGCLHPIQSFHSTETDPSILNGIGCGVEGPEAFATEAWAIARYLGWNPLRIRKENKPLYHAACVFAGNFLVALADDAGRILQHAADSPAGLDHLLPMMEAVLARLHDTPINEAVTGPAARGDHMTAGLHADVLEGISEEYRHIYSLWTRRILDITGADEATVQRMTGTLHPPDKD